LNRLAAASSGRILSNPELDGSGVQATIPVDFFSRGA
jgi:hypothetical protein